MKKLDKLILSSFIGPFFITFFVVVFILLTQFMLRYFDEIIGKDLGFAVISQLIFYFSINMTTNALPLAVLLSSLMTFGNLGEHFELTAIKGAGISLLRTMRPLFVVACILVVIGFFNNNYIVPQANLEAFSLLYDIKQKKPALDIKQGVFYHGIPGYSIKINHKFPDDETLKDIIIYNHAGQRGNKEIILADSGKMYNILDNRYLVLELFKGKNYSEQPSNNKRRVSAKEEANPYFRSQFDKSKIVFSLSEFDLKRTRKDLFSNNRLMKNLDQLKTDLDSMNLEYERMYEEIEQNTFQFFKYHLKNPDEITGRPVKKPIRTTPLNTGKKVNTVNLVRENNIDTDSLPSIKGLPDDSLTKNPLKVIKLKNEKILATRSGDTLSRKGSKANVITRITRDSASDLSWVKDSLIADSLRVDAKEDFMETDSLITDLGTDSLMVSDSVVLSDSMRAVLNPYYKIDSLMNTDRVNTPALGQALNHVRYVKSNLASQNIQMANMIRHIRIFTIEKYKKLAMAMTILAMFLIGAPLGAIIKRGGLGMPVLLSILFFVLFYVISMLGEKWARQGLMSPLFAVWLANGILFLSGFFFLRQARRDARLFDSDYYRVWFEKVRKKFKSS